MKNPNLRFPTATAPSFFTNFHFKLKTQIALYKRTHNVHMEKKKNQVISMGAITFNLNSQNLIQLAQKNVYIP